jgi:hypothetical protein
MSENTNPAGNPVITNLTNATTVPTSAGVQMVSTRDDEGDELEHEASQEDALVEDTKP